MSANDSEGMEPDEPLTILQEQEYDTPSDFAAKVKGKIHRKTAAAQFTAYSWRLPKAILVEMVHVMGQIVHLLGTKKGNP